MLWQPLLRISLPFCRLASPDVYGRVLAQATIHLGTVMTPWGIGRQCRIMALFLYDPRSYMAYLIQKAVLALRFAA